MLHSSGSPGPGLSAEPGLGRHWLSGSRIPHGSLLRSCQTSVTHRVSGMADTTSSGVFLSRTFLSSHWSSAGRPANQRTGKAVVDFPQPGSLHRPGKTWSDAGLLLSPRHCRNQPGFFAWAWLTLSPSSQLVGNSRKLNEGNLHKTHRLSHYTRNCPRNSLHRHTICSIR